MLPPLLWMLACPSPPAADTGLPTGPDEVDCLNGIDDDKDGRIDCADAVCGPTCDADGDGFLSVLVGGDDCDDALPFVYPAAPEVCNGVDDDCDRLADDQDVGLLLHTRTEWHPDDDRDGYGARFAWVTTCDAPAGYLSDATDCDDGDASVFPGAPEQCAAPDEDCDGLYGEDDPDLDAAAQLTWYPDDDGDGLGAPGPTSSACLAPPGHVPDGSDCDDTDPLLPALFWVDGDGDGVGAGAITDEISCTPPGAEWVPVSETPDCNDADDAISPDRVEQCDNGFDDDCSGRLLLCGLAGDWPLATTGAVLLPDQGEVAFGRSAVGGPDFDGDGLPDVIVGAVDSAVLISAADLGESVPTSSGSGLLLGEPGDDAFATLLAPGDADGDGRDDVLLGGATDDAAGAGAGAVWLLRGPIGVLVDVELGAASKWSGAPGSALSVIAGPGDVNADGHRDLALGAPNFDGGAGPVGAVFVVDFEDGVTGRVEDFDKAQIIGPAPASGVGAAVAVLPDQDGDGLSDLVVGAGGDDIVALDSGRVGVFRAPVLGAQALEDATLDIRGVGLEMGLGSAVVGPIDLDGDGRDDVVSSSAIASSGAGAAWGWFDPQADDTPVGADLVINGIADLAAGAALVSGDFDADGRSDLAIGNDPVVSAAAAPGMSWVLYGPLGGTLFLIEDATARFFGENQDGASAIAVLQDVDGNAASELLVGGPSALDGSGSAWILGGGAL